MMPEELIGKVSTFFAKPVVAGIDLGRTLNTGDTIHVKGHTTDLTFSVASMQVSNAVVASAGSGEAVGIKVPDRCRPGDEVFRVS
jgi:leucyl aminopeptidase (aminopeptidase T)